MQFTYIYGACEHRSLVARFLLNDFIRVYIFERHCSVELNRCREGHLLWNIVFVL